MLAAPGAAQAVGGMLAGDSLLVARPGIVRQPLTFSGIVGGDTQRPRVEVQIAQADGSWATIARARANGSGAFSATWRPLQPGRFSVRAVPTGAPDAGATATATVSVMRPAVATWYDQAGTTTSCRVKLERTTLGVAHRTLPCGTKLEFSFRGRSVMAPVIDRGPGDRRVSYDLTLAAARKIGFVSTGRGTVGVLEAATPLSAPAPAPGIATGRRR